MLTVVVAGIPRSGSTWLFNVARLVLQGRYATLRAGWIEDRDGVGDADAELVKLHAIDADWRARADRLFCSHRDLRDIAASMLSMRWATGDADVMAVIANVRLMHEFWSPAAAVDVAFERLVAAPDGVVRDVAAALGVPEVDVGAVLDAIPRAARAPGARGHDPISLLHAGHVTDGRPGRWRDQLPEPLAAALWDRHGDWLTAHGYTRT